MEQLTEVDHSNMEGCTNAFVKSSSKNLPPMPTTPPPPPPPVSDGPFDPNIVINIKNDRNVVVADDENNGHISDDNSGIDTAELENESEQKKSMSLIDALGRRGMYTGETVLDTSTGNLLPHGNQGVMLYDHDEEDNGSSNNNSTKRKLLKPIKYIGSFMLGHWHGNGSVMYSNGDSYVGGWKTSLKHGEGIYGWADGREYSGNYEQDFRQGAGKYTWPGTTTTDDGTSVKAVISYTGNFENNQRCGFGTYIDEILGIEYSGEWKNGMYDGYGIYQWHAKPSSDNRLHKRHVYRGNFKDGKPHGQGIEVLPDGSTRHDGIWENGEPVFTDSPMEPRYQINKTNATNASYVTASSKLPPSLLGSNYAPTSALPPRSPSGSRFRKSQSSSEKKSIPQTIVSVVQNQTWKDSSTGCTCIYRGLWNPVLQCPDGNGTAVYDSGAVQTYEGCFKAGLYHGQGRLWYRNGDMYEGTFIAGQRHTDRDPATGNHSVALYRWKDGRQYTGQFNANVRQGRGTLVYANQDLYEGDFVAGQREGQGRFVFASDGSCYTGEWQAGQYHGQGTLVHGHGQIYTGKFQAGLEHGHGKFVDSQGVVIYEGEWIQGRRKDEVEAEKELQKIDAERKHEALKKALADLDSVEKSDTSALTKEVPFFRTWADKSQQRNSTVSAREAMEEGDNRKCEAVVNEPVTDLLGCPGHYTGIVDSMTRLPHGVGRLVYADGKRIHEGFWKVGCKEGHGRCLFFPQGDFHEGEYWNNLRHGPGRYQWKDGRRFHGTYENDLRHGHGIFTYPSGEVYDGNFAKGQRSGFGRFDFIDHGNGGRKGYYEGLWKDGMYDGSGYIVWGDGVSYTGDFASGTFHGHGSKKDAAGNVIREGYWDRGMESETNPMEQLEEDQNLIPTMSVEAADHAKSNDENASIDSLEFSDNGVNAPDTEEKKDDDRAEQVPDPVEEIQVSLATQHLDNAEVTNNVKDSTSTSEEQIRLPKEVSVDSEGIDSQYPSNPDEVELD